MYLFVLTSFNYQQNTGDTAPKIQFKGQVMLIWSYGTGVGIYVIVVWKVMNAVMSV